MSKEKLLLPLVEESTLVFEESLIKIRRDTLRINQHPSYRYYSLLTHPYAVVILATTAEGAYVLTEEYRHPTGQILLSCPGGYVDPQEDPLEAAKRELKEETGFQANAFYKMGGAFPYAGLSAQKTFYIRATQAEICSTPRLEPSEIIQTRLFFPEEISQAIEKGAELDGTLCTALFFNTYRQVLNKS
jgi:ADP-ribose pyrophosphatase